MKSLNQFINESINKGWQVGMHEDSYQFTTSSEKNVKLGSKEEAIKWATDQLKKAYDYRKSNGYWARVWKDGKTVVMSIELDKNAKDVVIKESEEVNEKLDMNDPMLIALRARKSKDLKNAKKIAEMKKKRVYGKQRERLESDLEDIRSELSSLYSDRASTLDEMESEAGSKGSDWSDDDANKYGSELNKIEDSISKLLKKRSDIETKLAY